MTDYIEKAYAVDIDFRLNGFEKANEEGYKVEAKEIQPGIIYQDDRVTVEAFPVSHGTLESYGFKFTTPDKVIVISGDTAPLEIVAEKAKDCDILLHEVEYTGRAFRKRAEVAEVPSGGSYLKRGSGEDCAESAAEASGHLPPDLSYGNSG